jgi:uncharacterized protein (TIGR03066 family)
MKTLLSLSLAALFGTALVAAPVPKTEPTMAEKVVGKWKLAKSRGTAPDQLHVVEFTKDGKMILTVGEGDDAVVFKGKYKVEKEAIDYELMFGEDKKAEALKIKKITDKAMTTEDPDGIVEEFERIEEKKKDEKKEEKKEDKKPQ